MALNCFGSLPHGCHTAQHGEQCYMHVKYAMQTGIVASPDHYPALSNDSTFEEFQALLHLGAHQGCPMPCPPLPIESCHTSEPGELCHRHVTWAMKTGIHDVPEWYPKLDEHSSFEAFQAWLHHLHHGDCPKPCEVAVA